ncbi:Ig-like domain-containing protein [Nocardioides sp. CN2-186]|uniref:Ig-like domain-containing protein n=1 Tax=Nocardioides tweenelious TaxID=3156607 RepID=UPI0032B3874E
MRTVRLLAAAALTLAALVAVTPAQAAPGDGTLKITVVDEHGDPAPGSLSLYNSGGLLGIGAATQVSDYSLSTPPGSYGVLSLTPWGGMVCAGVDRCDYYALSSGTAAPNGTVQVVAGQTTTVVIEGRQPVRMPRSARVGKPLELQLSPGFQTLVDYFDAVGGGSFYTPAVTWLRDGHAIAEADGFDYVPTTADAGHSLVARLAYSGIAASQFETLTGAPVEPRQTGSVKVSKVPSKAYVRLSRSTISSGHQAVVRVDATAPGQVLDGKAEVSIGSWSQTKALRNGVARFRTPPLKPGTYDVKATYLGSATYSPSVARKKVLTVTK